ncbi:MAG TPA: uroporphyrinogen-III C-methyltransferase [Pseudonocardiaceae bacterium]|jgi:uroporphyrin-III C-methyltransferase/precorrin-2 dehydrogenase/sirohydrochlorin ferrochelatase
MTDAPDAAERHYLAGLDLAGRRVVVVGAGTVAQRRLPRLLAAGADVLVVAPEATPAVEGLAAAGELRWERRPYRAGDLDGAWYALACTSSPAINEQVCRHAEELRVYCVRADRGLAGSAVTPATAEHDGMLIGVLSGGRPRRSAAVRDGLLEALRSGTVPDDVVPVRPGVALVGGGPGDPDLITVRGRRLLARADVVIADRLAPRELLDELGPHVEVIDAAKLPYGRAADQDELNATMVARARAGRFVVRLKGGDPYLFGRGYEELLACLQAGVHVAVVPGVTSAFAVPAAAGVPVTHRGVAHEVVVVSGHLAPDDPESLVSWPAVARLRGTLVLLMAVQRMAAVAAVLIAGGRSPDTPVAVVADGTRATQRSLRSTLGTVADDIAAAGIRPPAVIVIGEVAALDPSAALEPLTERHRQA